MAFLPQVDLVVVMKDGQVSEFGTYDELIKQKGPFADLVIQYLSQEADGEDEDQVGGVFQGCCTLILSQTIDVKKEKRAGHAFEDTPL